MKRVLLIAILLVLVGVTSPAVAQEDATELSECNPESDSYLECLTAHTTAQDVLGWLNQTPDELTKQQEDALYEFNLSSLSSEQADRVVEWREWSSGADKPDWFGAPGGTTTVTPTPNDQRPDSRSEDAEDVDKWRQIRPGQWIVEKPEFYDNGTGRVVVFSSFDGRIALVDNGDCDGGMRVCQPDVTNSKVAAEETTTIWFDASVMTGTLSNGNQAVTLNSLTDRTETY
ncbi:hypothetical protein, partial [Haloprofundus marisrubri]|uniref:hypothetical protein n=1 Tax=Haloprofundus marisrubri TaxID=1514971 RepID=UPI0012BAE9E4